MSKKSSPQDKALDFFLSAPMPEAVAAFNAIKRIMFNRQVPAATAPAPTTAAKKRKPRTAKKAVGAVAQRVPQTAAVGITEATEE